MEPKYKVWARLSAAAGADPQAHAAYMERLETLRDALPARFRPMHFALAGYGSVEALRRASDLELLAVPQIGVALVRGLRLWLAAHPPPAPEPLPDWVAEE